MVSFRILLQCFSLDRNRRRTWNKTRARHTPIWKVSRKLTIKCRIHNIGRIIIKTNVLVTSSYIVLEVSGIWSAQAWALPALKRHLYIKPNAVVCQQLLSRGREYTRVKIAYYCRGNDSWLVLLEHLARVSVCCELVSGERKRRRRSWCGPSGRYG